MFTIIDALNSFEMLRNDSLTQATPPNQSAANYPQGQTTVTTQPIFHPHLPSTTNPITSYLMEKEPDQTKVPVSSGQGKSLGASTFHGNHQDDKKDQPLIIAGKWIVQETPCSVTCGQGNVMEF